MWKRFVPGDKVGAVEVIDIAQEGDTTRTQIYRIRYACCGEVKEISHRSLKGTKLDTSQCRNCCEDQRNQVKIGPTFRTIEILDIDGRRRPWPANLGELGMR